jgi:tetratricopeptide (TPR) repeat protein
MAYEIPPAPVHFVDREEEQARAVRAVAEWDGRDRPLCLAFSGFAGLGKTELVFRLARRLGDRYPDGILYVNLDDLRQDGAVDGVDALGELLAGLGVDPALRPPTQRARAKQYWTLTRDRRLLVLIDNARYGSEVVPLLPASGAAAVIVTSHGPLHDLEAGGGLELTLAPLPDERAVELLALTAASADAPDPRLAADPAAAVRLARICSGVPAALHVAGQLLRRHRGRPLGRVLARLGGELEKGLPMVERVWDAAYHDLGADARRLYRLLAVLPGGTFTPAAATALLGRGADTGEDALDELRAAGLLDTRDTRGAEERFRLPDLLRAHARRRADAEARATGAGADDGDGFGTDAFGSEGSGAAAFGDEGFGNEGFEGGGFGEWAEAPGGPAADSPGTAGEAAEGAARIVRWYLRQAQRADRLLAGRRMTLAAEEPELPGAPDVMFGADGSAWAGSGAADDAVAGAGGGGGAGPGAAASAGGSAGAGAGAAAKRAAARWLESERHALFGSVATAHGLGLDTVAWALCEPLWTHFLDHRHYADVTDAFRTGVAAAQRSGDVRALIRMRCQLARPLWEQGHHDEAAEQIRQALTACAALGESKEERKLAASTAEFAGMARSARGDWAGAAEQFAASREVHRAIGNDYGVRLQTYRLGEARAALRDWAGAERSLTEARGGFMELGRDRLAARAGFALGTVLRATGRATEARPLYETALATARDRGAGAEELRVLDELAALAAETGDDAAAAKHRSEAEEIRRRNGLT